MIPLILRVSILVAVLAPCAAYAGPPAFAVKAHYDLTPAADGFTGRLEPLEDNRITPELDKTLWQSGGPEMALDENDPLLKQLAASPLQPAVLRLCDAKGNIVAERKLEREQARLEPQQLHPGHRSFLITTDLSAGMGSYSGPSTRILDLSRGTLTYIRARDASRNTAEAISLASTLKTAYRIVKGPLSSGAGSDLLQVACRPDSNHLNSGKFRITYTRFHWTGTQWVQVSSQRAGFWESDHPFPPLARFPQVPKVLP